MDESTAYSLEALTRRRPLTSARSFQESSSSLAISQDSPKLNKAPLQQEEQGLTRSLNLPDIIFYGVGCSVGAGIYSLVGIGAKLAGPSIALSFFLCGLACCFTSLSYAEFAARVPLAGSAYTFTYVSFGELCGWLVGWNLTLGYAVSAAVVARSWAEYLVDFVEGVVGTNEVLKWLTHAPIPLFGAAYTCCPLSMVIIGVCTVVLITGAKESTKFNTAMTLLNLTVLAFVLLSGVGSGTVHGDNLTPVFPHGLPGMARGAGLVFFAYLGFDMVACLSEEVQNPERNLPVGIIGSLLVSMAIYVSVSIVVVGMAPVVVLGEEVPIINALLANACCPHSEQLAADAAQTCLDYTCRPILHPILYYGSRLISFGAIFGLTTATFACLMGQPRIFYSMAQDGLLFKIYARVHPKTGVPTIGTILTGIFTALVACLVDLESLANAISLGTLQVFTFVNAGVILLRMRPPVIAADEGEMEKEVDEEPSPSLSRHAAESVARYLGIVKRTSSQIRHKYLRSLGTGASNVSENGNKPIWLVVLFSVCSFVSSAAFSQEWHIGIAIVCACAALVFAIALSLLPKADPPQTFTCPMVPGIPLMGIVCNSYMMGSMPLETWSVILAWLLAGLLLYLMYGIRHSELRKKKDTTDDGNTELSGLLSQRSLDEGYTSVR